MNKINNLEDIIYEDRPATIVPQTKTNKKEMVLKDTRNLLLRTETVDVYGAAEAQTILDMIIFLVIH